MYKINKG